MSKDTQKDVVKKTVGSEFLCRPRYTNTLPAISIPPRHLVIPVDYSSLIEYQLTDIEREYVHPIFLNDPLAAIPIDSLEFEYWKSQNGALEKEDEELIADISLDRKRISRPEVSWLRRTEYISSEVNKSRSNRKSTRKSLVEETISEDQKRTIIASSFDKKELKHPTKPHLKVVEDLPLYPDLIFFGQTFSRCFFDDCPNFKVQKGDDPENSEFRDIQGENGILRGVTNPNDPSDQFLAFYLPSETFLKDQKDEKYLLIREYDFQAAENDPKFAFIFHGDKVTYFTVDSRINLKKRRKVRNGDNMEVDEDLPKVIQVSRAKDGKFIDENEI
ncbi:hypothetical protein ROZALSC1DRAFT_28007 [Rozella allomycis CSF55]|uniref:RNA polymerase II-associated, Paf1 domain-containing protein n=1 Tax=Rozella allomycis (strain CSF55) TaxID=988480 RepID=A0A075AVD3_ROZAC|nr:RNA polymerase II-associated, Paf1 domain-containing protein [Rozella allomycis CSF55]RKP20502.1 hypothetical protein ROZALSC1DRAFT_28007 [Rozella allomycis CSF55]|eukprot:EPZ34218.1 RNA polymerase II-associated, Paf1 domain-containing protein [Rozella allomycis CSF55]